MHSSLIIVRNLNFKLSLLMFKRQTTLLSYSKMCTWLKSINLSKHISRQAAEVERNEEVEFEAKTQTH